MARWTSSTGASRRELVFAGPGTARSSRERQHLEVGGRHRGWYSTCRSNAEAGDEELQNVRQYMDPQICPDVGILLMQNEVHTATVVKVRSAIPPEFSSPNDANGWCHGPHVTGVHGSTCHQQCPP